MPPPYSASQRSAIAQFVGFTQAKDSVAAKQLKAHGWNVEQAIDGDVFLFLSLYMLFMAPLNSWIPSFGPWNPKRIIPTRITNIQPYNSRAYGKQSMGFKEE